MHCWPFPETPQGASFKSVTRDGAHGRGCEVARVGSEPARAGVCVPRDWASALRGRERLRAQAGARAQAANAIPRPAGRQAGRRCLQVALGAWRGVFQSQTLIPNPSELEPLARAIRLLSGGRWGGGGLGQSARRPERPCSPPSPRATRPSSSLRLELRFTLVFFLSTGVPSPGCLAQDRPGPSRGLGTPVVFRDHKAPLKNFHF